VITGTNKRPLKSLSDTLKGKQGRFRQNLLGKRVDYSGRTVITVGPDLRLHQCGLPKKMALELFKPFLYYRLEQKGMVSTVKSAKKMVEREIPEVWDTLDEVVKEYPVLLNRAPTLHRLGIQAFEPILIEGKALQLHPLVCTAFNADFDGDQMAVHIPLSVEAQIEARVLMLSSNNILSPANGSPIIVPSQDIVLGIYYITRRITDIKNGQKIFANAEEVRSAYDAGAVDLHTQVTLRIHGKRCETTVGRVLLWEIIPKVDITEMRHIRVSTKEEVQQVLDRLSAGEAFVDLVRECSQAADKDNDGLIGKLTFNEFKGVYGCEDADVEALYSLNSGEYSKSALYADESYHLFEMLDKKPAISFDIVNHVMDKKRLRDLVDYVYRNLGPKATVILSDRLKDLGYKYSTQGGLSISIDAMITPDSKPAIIKSAEKQVAEISRQYTEGLITQGEKYNKVVDIWAKATDDVANEMMEAMKRELVQDQDGKTVLDVKGKVESFNPIYMMADSGARGSKDQMRQLAGMRGLMAKPSGEIIETPIVANFREGLSVLQYFISTHGARKGLADTALKTANSGYLTRRLADVAQDCVVLEEDCGTMMGVEVEPLMEGGEVIQHLGERILGRVATDDIIDPFTEEIICPSGQAIDEALSQKIEEAGLGRVNIRSVLTCRAKSGVCSKCYGRDLSHGRSVEVGQAVGILAAQSIGEPGTQLTMRTFHIGGTASRRVEQADIRARVDGTIKFIDLSVARNSEKRHVVMNRRGGKFTIFSDSGRELESFPVIYGAHLQVKDDSKVKAGDLLATWDPFTTPILSEVDGGVKFGDIVIGRTMQEKVDPVTGKSSHTIIESKNADERPRISIKDKDGKTAKLPESTGVARYILPINAILLVEEGDEVKAGDVVAKLPRATTKTKDITGGLPRVAELFEVRKPKEIAVLSQIDGYVSIAKSTKKGKQKVTVTPVDVGEKKEYLIPRGKHINVYEGDYIRAGEPLIGGSAIPQDILSIKGEVSLARYLVDEVQEVYRLQGVRINDKHIEVIVRQMMRRVKVISVGDSDFIMEEQVNKIKFEEANRALVEKDGQPAIAEPLILGITKASLSTDSFISAASFQETTKVLTDASIAGSVDPLNGLKENVIMGRLIPAGTGMALYNDVGVEVAKASR
jgi:DNA-directed RNA polymerase subunit beta'